NEIIASGNGRGLGFSHLASTGNETDVSAADIIDFYVNDPSTDVVLGVLEAIRNPEVFMQAAERAAAAKKPLVIRKLGASDKAARSALTHTGALAGNNEVIDAAFKQKGVIRVPDIDELVEALALPSPG